MGTSAVVDVALGLFFIYLLLSLLCSTVTEWMSRLLSWRAKDLKTAVAQMVGGNSKYTTDFWQHQLIAAGVQRGKTPSYLEASVFRAALLDIVRRELPAVGEVVPPSEPRPAETEQSLRSGLASIKAPELSEALIALLDDAGGDTAAFHDRIDKWFNDTMDRVSGWYKRRSQLVLGLLALGVAVALNVDSIAITRALWIDKDLRATLVAREQNLLSTKHAPSGAPSDSSGGTVRGLEADVTANSQPSAPPSVLAQGGSATPSRAAQRRAVPEVPDLAALREDLGSASSLIGWTKGCPCDAAPSEWFLSILGWLATAIAISLGAPFWFDVLSKLSNLRSTGVKPVASQNQSGAS